MPAASNFKWIAEPSNGWIKHVLGLRQFSQRGCTACKRRSSWSARR